MPRVKYPFVFMFVASIYVCAMCMCHLASASHIKVNQATPEIEENLTGRQHYSLLRRYIFIQFFKTRAHNKISEYDNSLKNCGFGFLGGPRSGKLKALPILK